MGNPVVVDRELSRGLASGVIQTAPDFRNLIKKDLVLPVDGRHPTVDFVRPSDRTEAIGLLLDLASKAPDTAIVRFAGGCKGFTPEMESAFVNLTIAACMSQDGERAFRGTAGSGATKELKDDGTQKVMITQAPYLMGRHTDCMTWGSAPQTARATQDVDNFGALRISKYGALLDEHGHGNFVTQETATTFQGWDGDVRLYMEAIEACKRHEYKTAIVTINGGDITKDEALLALSKGIPVILVEGSLRAADELVQVLRSADPEAEIKKTYEQAFSRGLLNPEKDSVPSIAEISKLVKFAQLNSPASLSAAFDELGLLVNYKPEA